MKVASFIRNVCQHEKVLKVIGLQSGMSRISRLVEKSHWESWKERMKHFNFPCWLLEFLQCSCFDLCRTLLIEQNFAPCGFWEGTHTKDHCKVYTSHFTAKISGIWSLWFSGDYADQKLMATSLLITKKKFKTHIFCGDTNPTEFQCQCLLQFRKSLLFWDALKCEESTLAMICKNSKLHNFNSDTILQYDIRHLWTHWFNRKKGRKNIWVYGKLKLKKSMIRKSFALFIFQAWIDGSKFFSCCYSTNIK